MNIFDILGPVMVGPSSSPYSQCRCVSGWRRASFWENRWSAATLSGSFSSTGRLVEERTITWASTWSRMIEAKIPESQGG